MTETLKDRLSTAIDGAAEPITPKEVMHRRYADGIDAPSPRASHRRKLVAAAAIAIVVIAGAGMWIQNDQRTALDDSLFVASRGQTASLPAPPSSAPATLEPSTLAAIDPATCGNINTTGGCRATPAQAEQALGIPLPDPKGIPAGWEPVESSWLIRYYDDEPLMKPGDPGLSDYNQAWAPAGEALNEPTTKPSYLRITRRTSLANEEFHGLPVELPNGVTAFGRSGYLAWESQGVTTKLRTGDLSAEDLKVIATSLV